MLPDFALAPWELPPDCDAPLVAPADFVFRYEWGFGLQDFASKTETWVRVVLYKDAFIHYFCDGESASDGNWIMSHDGSGYNALLERRQDVKDFESWFQSEVWLNCICRLVCFDGAPFGFPGIHYITAPPASLCFVRVGTSTSDEFAANCARFSSPFENEITPASSATMKNYLFAALNDERSEVRFALSWIHLSPEKQQLKQLDFERQTLDAMRQLLRAALHTQADIWEKQESLVWETSEIDQRSLRFIRSRRFVVEADDVLSRLERWRQAIWNAFFPNNDEWLLFAWCVREWQDIGSVKVEAAPPSAHEQIEALLLLRDWWNQHFPPELFDAHNSDDEVVQQ